MIDLPEGNSIQQVYLRHVHIVQYMQYIRPSIHSKLMIGKQMNYSRNRSKRLGRNVVRIKFGVSIQDGTKVQKYQI